MYSFKWPVFLVCFFQHCKMVLSCLKCNCCYDAHLMHLWKEQLEHKEKQRNRCLLPGTHSEGGFHRLINDFFFLQSSKCFCYSDSLHYWLVCVWDFGSYTIQKPLWCLGAATFCLKHLGKRCKVIWLYSLAPIWLPELSRLGQLARLITHEFPCPFTI